MDCMFDRPIPDHLVGTNASESSPAEDFRIMIDRMEEMRRIKRKMYYVSREAVHAIRGHCVLSENPQFSGLASRMMGIPIFISDFLPQRIRT